jgi:uncharacterized protein (TIGR02453 family)
MADRFEGFPAGAFSWFAGLEADNTKAYFTATREVYDRDVRGALIALLEELSERFGGRVRVFRQQRNLRFSADKTPYKTRTYGVLEGPTLYADLSARGLYAGTGYHGLDAGQLARYRAAVLDDAAGGDLEDRVAAVEAAGMVVAGPSLRTAPRGVARDHPRIALLRRRALFGGAALPGAAGIAREAALAHVAGAWTAARPLTAWLDEHVGAGSTRA